jgi:flagellar assembly protein FliH
LSNSILPKDAAARARPWELRQFEAGVDELAPLIPRSQDHLPPGLKGTVVGVAVDELNRLREQAAREGFEQGLLEGRERGARDAAELKILVASLREVAQALEQTLAERIVDLAVELARAVVRRAIDVQPEFVIDVVREAVASLPEIEAHTEIALHPEDALLLRNVLRSDPNAALTWHVVEDSGVSRGGCRVSTRSSEIDATLEARWRRIVSGLGRDDRWLSTIEREATPHADG